MLATVKMIAPGLVPNFVQITPFIQKLKGGQIYTQHGEFNKPTISHKSKKVKNSKAIHVTGPWD
jgi:hypothetical protein